MINACLHLNQLLIQIRRLLPKRLHEFYEATNGQLQTYFSQIIIAHPSHHFRTGIHVCLRYTYFRRGKFAFNVVLSGGCEWITLQTGHRVIIWWQAELKRLQLVCLLYHSIFQKVRDVAHNVTPQREEMLCLRILVWVPPIRRFCNIGDYSYASFLCVACHHNVPGMRLGVQLSWYA